MCRDIRMSGFRGCLPSSSDDIENDLNDKDNFQWDIDNELKGYDYDSAANQWDPALPTGAPTNVLAGTDIIASRYMSPETVSLTAPYSQSGQLFVDPNDDIFNVGDILMVTDCHQGSIFQLSKEQVAGGKDNLVHSAVANQTMQPGNADPVLNKEYGADSKLARMRSTVFYIANNGEGNPALYRSRLVDNSMTAQLNAEELVEGVEDMQFLYGEDTNGDKSADRYLNAKEMDDNGGNMSNVVAVRVAILVRSEDNVKPTNDNTTKYTLLDKIAGPFNDRRLRQVFTTTIALRNRLGVER